MTTPADTSGCRCGGTGAYTAEIPVSDAVVLIRRVCVDHLARRTRVKDTTSGRIGQVMDIMTTTRSVRVYLRPVDGGKEWTADSEALEPVDAT